MPGRRPAERGARAAAGSILERVDSGRGHSNALLADLPETMDDRERALATELVYGVLRRRSALDRVLLRASTRPLGEIDAPVLVALRVAAYQILHLTRVPRSAAVDEAVSIVRARAGRPAAGFANGVLRSVCRDLDRGDVPAAPARPDPDTERAAYLEWLAESRCFPRFLAERFLGRYGPSESEALMEAMNRPAPVCLRIRRAGEGRQALARRLREEGVETADSDRLDSALRVVRGAAQRTAAFQRGDFYIQDEASQLVARLVEPLAPGDRLVDLCASPGGKILAAIDGRPAGARQAVAADISRARLALLRENARRAGARGPLCVAMDAARPALRGRFERILLDAPCSGTGIIRRHPEIRWRRSEEDILRFARLQHDTLVEACSLLAPAGRMVYAVCSLEPEEGLDRIAALLEARRDMVAVDAGPLLPPPARSLVDARGFFITLPHRDDVDGFFAAVLERRAGT